MKFRTRVNDDSTAALLGEYDVEKPSTQSSQRQSSRSRIEQLSAAPVAGEWKDYQLEIKEQHSPYGSFVWDCPACHERFQGGGKDALTQRALDHLRIAHDRKVTKDHRAALHSMNERNHEFWNRKEASNAGR